MDQISTEATKCKYGVPQGSILGPVLYLIYVNSMFNCMENCTMFMYAYDTVIISENSHLGIALISL